MKLPLSKIRIDGGTQPRAGIDTDHVAELAEHADKLPPVTVFHDGKAHWLADGFHRFHARGKAGLKNIAVKVNKGTVRDAILFSVGANSEHGLKRSNSDKRRAIAILLGDKEWSRRSNNWIAEACKVSDGLVAELRDSPSNSGTSIEGKDGKKYPSTKWKDVSDKEPEATKEPTPEPELDADEVDLFDTTVPAVAPVRNDATGRPIEDLKIISIFNRSAELEKAMRAISDIKSLFTHGCDDNDELFAEINLSQFQADCKNIYNAIRFALPHAICRFCNGGRSKTCKNCNGRGWTGEAKFKATPEEMK